MPPLFKRRVVPIERRAFGRFPVGLKTSLVAIDDGPLSQPQRIELLDISGGGMRLAVKTYFDVGSRLHVAFTLPAEQRTNEAQVEVLSCKPENVHFIARCRFTELRMGGQLLDWTLARLTQAA
jgi:hypothetical protein